MIFYRFDTSCYRKMHCYYLTDYAVQLQLYSFHHGDKHVKIKSYEAVIKGMIIMNEMFHQLAEALLKKNRELSYEEARTWVEILWEDLETTRAKAGHPYMEKSATMTIVMQWINYYGPLFHEVVKSHPKFQRMINEHNFDKHE